MFKVNQKILRLCVVAIGTLLFSQLALAKLPDNQFACQVNTHGGKLGVVFVQADDRQGAREASASAMAWEMGGGRSKALNVVECILVANERFKDSWFQKFYIELEL